MSYLVRNCTFIFLSPLKTCTAHSAMPLDTACTCEGLEGKLSKTTASPMNTKLSEECSKLLNGAK